MSGKASSDEAVRALAAELERYIRAHPRSKDSLSGIRSWWLQGGTASASRDEVCKAVDDLVQRGLLVEETLPDGRHIYAAAQRKA